MFSPQGVSTPLLNQPPRTLATFDTGLHEPGLNPSSHYLAGFLLFGLQGRQAWTVGKCKACHHPQPCEAVLN